jgi:hypothetical protein
MWRLRVRHASVMRSCGAGATTLPTSGLRLTCGFRGQRGATLPMTPLNWGARTTRETGKLPLGWRR